MLFFSLIFIYLAMLGLSCCMGDRVSWPGIELGPLTSGAQGLATGEVPGLCSFRSVTFRYNHFSPLNDAIFVNAGAQGAERAHRQGPPGFHWEQVDGVAITQGTIHSERRLPYPSGDVTIAVSAPPAERWTSLPAIPTGWVPGGWVVSSVSAK